MRHHRWLEAVRGQRVQRPAKVRLQGIGGPCPAGVTVQPDDAGVPLAEEELDQAVPALRPAGAVLATDPQWLLASHVSVPSLVPSGSGLTVQTIAGGCDSPPTPPAWATGGDQTGEGPPGWATRGAPTGPGTTGGGVLGTPLGFPGEPAGGVRGTPGGFPGESGWPGWTSPSVPPARRGRRAGWVVAVVVALAAVLVAGVLALRPTVRVAPPRQQAAQGSATPVAADPRAEVPKLLAKRARAVLRGGRAAS